MIKLKSIAQVTVLATAIAASSAYAVTPGAYVGGSIGWGKVYEEGVPGLKNTNDGVAGRVFGGYQFDQNFGAEIGWNKFSDVRATGFGIDARASVYAVDLVAKATMPLSNGFSAYGKLGAAYLNESLEGSAFGFNLSGSKSEGKIFPTFGLGLNYDISPNMVADVSWNRIQKVGNSDLASTDMVGVGFSYYFA